MKKLYFETTSLARDFMSLCKKNDIKFNLPTGKGLVLCIEIPDDIKSWTFLNDNGFEE